MSGVHMCQVIAQRVQGTELSQSLFVYVYEKYVEDFKDSLFPLCDKWHNKHLESNILLVLG